MGLWGDPPGTARKAAECRRTAAPGYRTRRNSTGTASYAEEQSIPLWILVPDSTTVPWMTQDTRGGLEACSTTWESVWVPSMVPWAGTMNGDADVISKVPVTRTPG